jgi:hypothetical protein
MARAFNMMITYVDANYMINNEDFIMANSFDLNSTNCLTKSEILRVFENVDPSFLQDYENNQLVPYQKIKTLETYWAGIDPECITDETYWVGIDPICTQEETYWVGIDPICTVEETYWVGIDPICISE